MTAQPVRIEHALPERDGIVFVDWQLGNTCNYRCSYCPNGLHDGSVDWLDMKSVLHAATAVIEHAARANRRVHFQFTGGEPTLYPAIDELWKQIRRAGATVSVVSNGSRPLNWWKRAAELLNSVALSFHVEYAAFARFVAVANHLSTRIRTHINVTMPPTRFDECLNYARELRVVCPRATIALKPLRLGFGNTLYPYTPEELAVLDGETIANPPRAELGSVRGAMKVVYADGSTHTFEAGELLIRGLNRWRGWECYAGIDLITIDAAGGMFRGQCKQGGSFARVSDTVLTFPDEPVHCAAETCSCHSDIMNRRYLPVVS